MDYNTDIKNSVVLKMLHISYRHKEIVDEVEYIFNNIEYVPPNAYDKRIYTWIGDYIFLPQNVAEYFVARGFARVLTGIELENLKAQMLEVKQ